MADETQKKKMKHDRVATMMKIQMLCPALDHARHYTTDDNDRYASNKGNCLPPPHVALRLECHTESKLA
jgi:hypothetical protein